MSDHSIIAFDAENVDPKQREISPDLLRSLKDAYDKILAREEEDKASHCLPLQHDVSAPVSDEPEPESPMAAPNAGARTRELIREAREAEFEEA